MEVLIVIGAGRSGTTTLSSLLSKVPGLHFRFETNFLAPRLLSEIWSNHFWLMWPWTHTEQNPYTGLYTLDGKAPADLLDRERKTAGKHVAELLAKLLKIPDDAKGWGFKDIWNGGSSFSIPWETYDSIFPEARWLGIVRNPFKFAQSCAQWDKRKFDLLYLKARLFDWVSILEHSRKRATTQRYREIRFEELLSRPRHTLSYALEDTSFSLPEGELITPPRLLPSSRGESLRKASDTLVEDIQRRLLLELPFLAKYLSEFGYTLTPDVVERLHFAEAELETAPVLFQPISNPFTGKHQLAYAREVNNLQNELATVKQQLTTAQAEQDIFRRRILEPDHEERLCPPFAHMEGHTWVCPLERFRALADDNLSHNSPLQLLEDGRPLGPGHSLHQDIAIQGQGRYSHWENRLWFSTSDNSDPNNNGRTYSLRLPKE